MTKRCESCKEAKPLHEFGVLKSQPDGKNRKCKACVRAAYHKFKWQSPEAKAKLVEERLLNAKHRAEVAVAQPNRVNLFELDTYKPSLNAYYRNDGLKHIKSLTRRKMNSLRAQSPGFNPGSSEPSIGQSVVGVQRFPSVQPLPTGQASAGWTFVLVEGASA